MLPRGKVPLKMYVREQNAVVNPSSIPLCSSTWEPRHSLFCSVLLHNATKQLKIQSTYVKHVKPQHSFTNPLLQVLPPHRTQLIR